MYHRSSCHNGGGLMDLRERRVRQSNFDEFQRVVIVQRLDRLVDDTALLAFISLG